MYLMLQTIYIYTYIHACICVCVCVCELPERTKNTAVAASAWYNWATKIPIVLAKRWLGGWPCETVPMCCRALTEWNMSTRCQRQQASCLVISMVSAYRVYVLLLAAHTPGTGLELSQCHRYGQPFIAAFVRSVWLFLWLKCKITFRNPAAADD